MNRRISCHKPQVIRGSMEDHKNQMSPTPFLQGHVNGDKPWASTHCQGNSCDGCHPPCRSCRCRERTCWRNRGVEGGRHPQGGCSCACAAPVSTSSLCPVSAHEGGHALVQVDNLQEKSKLERAGTRITRENDKKGGLSPQRWGWSGDQR